MDLVAMRGLRRLLPAESQGLDEESLHRLALVGDLVSNSIYYAAVAGATANATWSRAAVLGSAAGLGALLLPQHIGLGAPPHSDSQANQVMTVAWYLVGAAAAAAVANALGARRPGTPDPLRGTRPA